jgi:hypothetical protein
MNMRTVPQIAIPEQEVKEANSGDRGFIYVVAYELLSYDEKHGYEFIGILPERRKDPKRIHRVRYV